MRYTLALAGIGAVLLANTLFVTGAQAQDQTQVTDNAANSAAGVNTGDNSLSPRVDFNQVFEGNTPSDSLRTVPGVVVGAPNVQPAHGSAMTTVVAGQFPCFDPDGGLFTVNYSLQVQQPATSQGEGYSGGLSFLGFGGGASGGTTRTEMTELGLQRFQGQLEDAQSYLARQMAACMVAGNPTSPYGLAVNRSLTELFVLDSGVADRVQEILLNGPQQAANVSLLSDYLKQSIFELRHHNVENPEALQQLVTDGNLVNEQLIAVQSAVRQYNAGAISYEVLMDTVDNARAVVDQVYKTYTNAGLIRRHLLAFDL